MASMRWLSMLLAALWLQATFVTGAAIAPSDLSRRQLSTPLRIMPLGDSITRGSMSNNTNGYRGYLQNRLVGVSFDFIGTLADGTMKDRSHQGHSGKVISDIRDFSLGSVGARPNVILVHAGTNDVHLQRDEANAPDRLASLVDQLFKHCPDATILVAKIIAANSPPLQARIDAYNSVVETRIASRAADGKHVALVDMSRILDMNTDLADTKHPNDLGYAKMAVAWLKGIQEAESKGWIKDPVEPEVTDGVGLNDDDNDNPGNSECAGSRWRKETNVANIRIWEDKGQIFDGYKAAKPENVHFADVTGDGVDDYLLVADDGEVRAWKGTGSGFKSMGVIAPGPSDVEGSKVHFADIDGDGLADYIVVYDGGSARAWKNLGKADSTDSQKWKELGTIVEAPNDVEVPGDKVHFADIDGDGLADYLIIYDGGSVAALRNPGKGKTEWQDLGVIAPGVNGVPGSNIRIVDFDGDGLADILVMYDGGAVQFYRNLGNLLNDQSPKWELVGVVAEGVKGVTRDNVRWANLDDDGLADYLVLSDNGAVKAYLNSGMIDRAKGVRFADLNGNNRDDLLWLHEDGSVDAWLNQGSSSKTRWRFIGRIARSPQGATRDKVVFADIDGDGLDDYLIRFDGGAVKAFINNGNLSPDGNNWEDIGTITDGFGSEGRKLQFADVDGDGLSDLLVIYDGSAVDAYKNNGLSSEKMFSKIGTIAGGVKGATGDNVRFADIDGDGTADYLLSYIGGAVEYYRNNGNLGKVPEKPSWEDRGVIAAGVQQQGIVLFGDLNGDGKADYLNVDYDTGSVTAYVNICASVGGPQPEEGPPGLIPDKEIFCAIVDDDSNSHKTEATWNAVGMDRQVERYTARIKQWPNNVQRTLLTYYDLETRQKITDGPCHPTEFCPFAPDGEVCLANPDLTFILLAIKNFSNYIDALTTALMGVHGIVQGKVGKLVENFMPGADPDEDITSSVLGMASGLLTIIGAFSPPAAAIAGGFSFTSALFGVLGSTAESQIFKTYAGIQDDLATSVSNVVDAVEDFALKAITEKPSKTGDNYVQDNHGIPKILANGVFAEPRRISTIPDGVVAGLVSPIIDHLWNKQQVVLVKADEEGLGTNPCPNINNGGISGISDDAIWCDPAGVAHILISWPHRVNFWNQGVVSDALEVTGIDKIGDYNLTIEAIRTSADRSQLRRGYLPDPDDPEFTKDILFNEDVEKTENLVSFTMPVCDTRSFDSDDIDCGGSSLDDDLCRFRKLAFGKCPELRLDGKDFPYVEPVDCQPSCNPGFVCGPRPTC